jgi:hypothetical protein
LLYLSQLQINQQSAKMSNVFTINFPDGSSAQAIHLNNEAEIPDAITKLGLRLGQPTIVLIGGAGGLTDDDLKKIEFLFVDILAPLAENLQANVIDGGTDAGVMRLMGQARAKANAEFPLIGIAAEGTIILLGIESSNPEAAMLESHHTHFILVPGNNWGDESPWLGKIAAKLSKTASSVTVLINGGEIAREDVKHSISQKRPVVVVAGSGRLADELASDIKDSPLIKILNLKESTQNIIELFTNLLKENHDG